MAVENDGSSQLYSGTFIYIVVYFCCMAMSIKSLDVERLARELASKTGDSLTGAIQKALEERLERVKRERRQQEILAPLEDILRRVDQLPVVDSRNPDEILGYDEHGLPH